MFDDFFAITVLLVSMPWTAVVRVGNGLFGRCSWGHTMDVAYLSAASALAGSIVGGLTSSLTTWITQRAQARTSYMAREMTRRDELYKDFIVAASKAYGDAIVSSEPQVQDLILLYAMVSRMRVQSDPRTVACAERIMMMTIGTFLAPNKPIVEHFELLKGGSEIDPLKEFSEAARDEMLSVSSRA